MGLGALLAEGIGDTIRVSLTGDPLNEIFVAKKILSSLDLTNENLTLISCPTCGRTMTKDFERWVNIVEAELSNIKSPLKVTVMGCAVNGPGEAKDADIGISFAGVNQEGKAIGILMRLG